MVWRRYIFCRRHACLVGHFLISPDRSTGYIAWTFIVGLITHAIDHLHNDIEYGIYNIEYLQRHASTPESRPPSASHVSFNRTMRLPP